MNDPSRRRWLSTVVLTGLLYGGVGLTAARLAGAAASEQGQFFWRLSAFILSAVVFTAHIAYEHFGCRNTAWTTSWHASLAAGVGALALALSANIHDLGSAAGYRPRMLVALVAWPVLTGVPAFIVALLVTAGLTARR